MPKRKIPLVKGEYYHVFNRSINKEPIFVKHRDCQRVQDTLSYYRFEKPPIRLSYYLALGVDQRDSIMRSMEKSKMEVDFIAFSLMPNHFHLLLRQTTKNGVSKFLALFQNSYTRYFNTKYDRQGHLFQGQFKAVRIEDDEQFIHVGRYIHLNPYSSFVVKSLEELEKYPFSSLPEYLEKNRISFCKQELLLSHFANREAYRKFVFDQADYQRELEKIIHLILE